MVSQILGWLDMLNVGSRGIIYPLSDPQKNTKALTIDQKNDVPHFHGVEANNNLTLLFLRYLLCAFAAVIDPFL